MGFRQESQDQWTSPWARTLRLPSHWSSAHLGPPRAPLSSRQPTHLPILSGESLHPGLETSRWGHDHSSQPPNHYPPNLPALMAQIWRKTMESGCSLSSDHWGCVRPTWRRQRRCPGEKGQCGGRREGLGGPSVNPPRWIILLFKVTTLVLCLFIHSLIFGCAGSWSLSAGSSLVAVHGLLVLVTSLVEARGFQGMGLSSSVAHGLSWPVACDIFPDQGLNPCPLHWQADS